MSHTYSRPTVAAIGAIVPSSIIPLAALIADSTVDELRALCREQAGDSTARRMSFVAPPPDDTEAFAQHDSNIAFCELCAPAAAIAAGFPGAVEVCEAPPTGDRIEVCEVCGTLLAVKLTAEGVEASLCELEQEADEGLSVCPVSWVCAGMILDAATTTEEQLSRVRRLIAAYLVVAPASTRRAR